MADKFGYITQVIGPVVDVAFEGEGNEVPPIYAALKIERENGAELIVEVEQHIGENTVRCVAMDSTDGLKRGMKAIDLQRPLSMPTGSQVKGRLMNVIGETIDHLPALDYTELKSIHRGSGFRRPLYQYRDALYGNQGDRFTRTVFERWKDRFVRRGRCW